MSSNRLSKPRSLRARLIALVVGLLAVVCVLVGVVTQVALDAFLMHELDGQLTETQDRIERGPPPDGPPPGGEQGPRPGEARGLAPGTVTARIVDGVVRQADVQTRDAEPKELDDRWHKPLLNLPSEGRPETRDLGKLGDYRLAARTGDDGAVLVTGLPLEEVHDTELTVGLILGGVSLAGLLVTGLGGALIVRRNLRPLERMADTATRVTELSLDRGEVDVPVRVPAADTDPATEVGRVGTALNRMLDHVSAALSARQESETRVRRFVADASHELRTPLASIRGYAELTRRHGDAVPPPVLQAMNRVEAESQRMTTLVEELLLLARLDAHRPLDSAPVDLTRLVADAVADARVAGPEHRWRLDLPAEPLTVTGDEAALHQVVSNLLANARTHTPAGTTVTAALTASDGVRLTVTDDGPGIAADLLPEIFERFARGDSSRSRTAGSTGLGLAIVAAVVQAHGGAVGVRSEPGATAFTVTLPG